MKRHSKALARLLAVLALTAAVVALIVVVSDSLGGGDSHSQRGRVGKHEPGGGGKERDKGPPRKAYVVQPGDTLSAIAHKTGVSIAQLQRLNPDVDPQILIAGDKLKLR